MEPPYAWPSPSVELENKAAVLAEILRQSFKQSGTKIKDQDAIISAARHIVQSPRVNLEVKV